MDFYINGTGLICATGNNINAPLKLSLPDAPIERYRAAEPDYKPYIPPMQLRRMSKPVRMGIAAAKACVKDLDPSEVKAISVGTSFGCLYDTEIFLTKMIQQEEQMLTPTAFIQSTHNTVAGAIALLMGCKGDNLTYVHKSHSFEHAIINACLYLAENPDATVIAGGIDEITDTSYGLLQEMTVFRKEAFNPATMYSTQDTGAISGEGAAFFSIAQKRKTDRALHVRNLQIFRETDCLKAIGKLKTILNQYAFQPDMVLTGESGDIRWEGFYTTLVSLVKNATIERFKHYTGEFATASAIGLALLADGVINNNWEHFPTITGAPQNILMVNNYLDYYSIWLCEVDNG